VPLPYTEEALAVVCRLAGAALAEATAAACAQEPHFDLGHALCRHAKEGTLVDFRSARRGIPLPPEKGCKSWVMSMDDRARG
jgi:hypothetical protein